MSDGHSAAGGINIFNHHRMNVQTTNMRYGGPTTTPFTVEGFRGGLRTFASRSNTDERRFGQFCCRSASSFFKMS